MATSSDFSPCTICEIRHLSNTATVWCPECETALCTGCKEHHCISKGTRNRATIPVEDYKKLPPFILNIQLFCEEHNEKFQMYCLNHEKPLCKKCIKKTHKECKDTATLDDVTGNIKSSWAMEAVEKRANTILDTIKQIEDDKEKNIANIYETKDNIIKQISNIRERVNQHLDKIQKDMVDELLSIAGKSGKRISGFLELLKAKRKKLDEIPGNIGKIKMYASDFQSFLGFKEVENIITEDEKYLQSAFDNGMLNQAQIRCNVDEKMNNFASICTTFGKLSMTTTALTINLHQQSSNEAQIPKFHKPMLPLSSVNEIRLESEREIKIGNTSDLLSTGCCVMPNGNIIFACYTSDRLAIHAKDGSYIDKIPTDLQVFDVTPIDQKTVAATAVFAKKILFFDIQTTKKIPEFYVAGFCFGITFCDGSLIDCVKGVGLQRLDMNTLKLSTIFEDDLGYPSFVTTFEGKTYFTNCKTRTLKVLDANMKKIWRLYDNTFLIEPTGVTVDLQVNIYVAENMKQQLVLISSDGKQRKHLKYKTDISDSFGLCYERSCSRIIVVGYDGKALFLDCS